ncbi:MAG TPA: BON domain-containing protein [Steroidobacteraceae bacterium]|nr:BON domain-containing protein [Steroidobacteraceae bacterium]
MADESRWRDDDRIAMDAEERARWNAWRDERDHGRYGREPGRYGREFGGAYGNYGTSSWPYSASYGRGLSRDNYSRDEYPRSGYERDYAPLYQGRGYRNPGPQRDWWDRTSDEVASWFGDDEAQQRRNMDAQDRGHRGRGPKGYVRSDERIREDVSDRLSDDRLVDASDIEVSVAGSEVTLSGTVNSREERRRAEDCAERVSGVSHVQNNLRVSATGSTATGAGNTGTRPLGRNENSLPGRSSH